MKYLIDTDWLVDYLNDDPRAVDLIDPIADDVALSVLTYAELLEGALGSYDPDLRSAQVKALARQVPPLPVELATAELLGQLRLELRRLGRPIPPYDLIPLRAIPIAEPAKA